MRVKLAAICICSGLAFAVLGQAAPARAAEATVTYFGVVANTQTILGQTEPAADVDNADLFGGGNLEGDFLTATYVYTTAAGLETLTPGVSDEIDGGSDFNSTSPLLSVTFDIEQAGSTNTYSYSYKPDTYASIFTSKSEIDDIGYSSAGDQSYAYIAPKGAGPTNLGQSFDGLGYGPGSYFDPAGTNTGVLDSIVFDTLNVTVSATPEPSTWALAFAAVAVAGGALRWRRRARGPLPGASLA